MELNGYLVFLVIVLLDKLVTETFGNNGHSFLKPSIGTNKERSYQIVVPVLYHSGKRQETTVDKNKHIQNATLVFDAFNKHFVIQLNLNRYLFSKSYVETVFNERNEPVISKPSIQYLDHCYYHGVIQDVPHSKVSLSTCQGIRGHISDDEQSYYIEPFGEKGQHRLIVDPDTRPPILHNEDLKFTHSSKLLSPTLNSLHRKEYLQRLKRSVKAPYDSNSNSKYLELYIVNDNSVYRQHRRDTTMISQRSQEIANYVSSLYQPLNIFVVLVGVETWTVRDLIQISSYANITLQNFLSYRRQSINPRHPNDNAQLITGVLFQDSIVGKAIKMSICTHQFSAAVVMDADSTTQVATTLAHELGHNFGMEHDNYSVCLCPEPKCIMATTGGGFKNPTKWSSCSQTVLKDNFEMGLDYCLKNIPEQLMDKPFCGNGFVEDGEECDCGLPQKCNNRCCNASSCKLMSNARCATGRCCDLSTCQPKSAATLCRPSPEECDLPEFCDGETEYCPSDVFVENGRECNYGQSYCYNGTCKSTTQQCKLLWGSTGRVSDPICFKMLNVNGSKYGNCGYNWMTRQYDRCDKDDVYCGLLHCVHLNEKLMFWSEQLSHATPATFLTKGDKKYVCRSAIMDVGLDMPDPGQVPDGSKCGDHKICLKKKCSSLSSVRTPSCPNCHGNGVCNNIGQCHCDEGYAPPSCNEPGHGGSLHSGPVKIQKVNGLMIGLLVFFLVVCPIIIIIVAVLNRQKLMYCWSKQSAAIVHRFPFVSRKGKGQKKKYSNGTAQTGDPKPRQQNDFVDISGPLLSENTPDVHKKTKPLPKIPNQKKEPLKPPNRNSPGVDKRFKYDPIVKKNSGNNNKTKTQLDKKKEIEKKDSLKMEPIIKSDKHETIARTDSSKEISKPVLISTTDRRSKAFVREASNDRLKDAINRTNITPPPVPAHSSPSIRQNNRPISMPQAVGKKDPKINSRKSVIETPQRPPLPEKNTPTTPPRPPAPEPDTLTSPPRPPLPASRDQKRETQPPAICKFKPPQKTSTNAAKSSIELKKNDLSSEKKTSRNLSEIKTKQRSKNNASSDDSKGQVSVAAVKNMFEQGGHGKSSSPALKPRPPPKPDSKVRSVNV